MKLNNNDYIDTKQFTEEECVKFCELAVSQGYGIGEWVSYYNYKWRYRYLGINSCKMYWFFADQKHFNNVSEQFREYLKWQPSVSPKSLLKDGMHVSYRSGDCRAILAGHILRYLGKGKYERGANLNNYSENLEHVVYKNLDIMTIVDRDGTTVWEREEQPEPKEMTVAEIEKALGHSIKVVK